MFHVKHYQCQTHSPSLWWDKRAGSSPRINCISNANPAERATPNSPPTKSGHTAHSPTVWLLDCVPGFRKRHILSAVPIKGFAFGHAANTLPGRSGAFILTHSRMLNIQMLFEIRAGGSEHLQHNPSRTAQTKYATHCGSARRM